jgi:hypothetical protein
MENPGKNAAAVICSALAGGAVLLFLFAAFRYGLFPGYLDHAEPGIAFRAWISIAGNELYPRPESEFYLLNAYGPITYFANGGVMALFGPSIATSKAAALGSAVLSLVLISAFIHRVFGRSFVGIGILFFSCFLLFACPFSIWNRPDPLMVFLVCAALFAATFDGPGARRWAVPAVIAICVGLSVNLKIHSFIFFVPIVWHYCTHRRHVVWPAMIALSVAVFLLPFALPQVSMANFVDGLIGLAEVREIEFGQIPYSLRYSLVFLSPGVVLALALVTRAGKPDTADIVYFFALVACIGASFSSTLLAGTFWYHMVPFFPVSLDLLLRFLRSMEGSRKSRGAVLVFLSLVFVILAVTPQKRLHRAILDREESSGEAAREVIAILDDHQGKTVQMGYGEDVADTYRLSYFKPLIAFAGNNAIVDGHADTEASFAGIPQSPARITHVAECRTDLWLIPKNETPFALKSYYRGGAAGASTDLFIYSDAFRSAFLEAYEKTEAHAFFDVWACTGR